MLRPGRILLFPERSTSIGSPQSLLHICFSGSHHERDRSLPPTAGETTVIVPQVCQEKMDRRKVNSVTRPTRSCIGSSRSLLRICFSGSHHQVRSVSRDPVLGGRR